MTTNADRLTENEKNEIDEAISEKALHHLKEVAGVTVMATFLTVIYGVATLFKGEVGENAGKALTHFVEHASGSVSANLLTVAIFVLSITMIFEGAKAAEVLQNFVVRPLLNLFQHSCALTLGVSIGYLVLTMVELKPRDEYRSAIFAIAIMLVALSVLNATRMLFEVLPKKIYHRICRTLISRFFPNVANDAKRLDSLAGNSRTLVFAAVGIFLALAACRQFPDDLKIAAKSSKLEGEVSQSQSCAGIHK